MNRSPNPQPPDPGGPNERASDNWCAACYSNGQAARFAIYEPDRQTRNRKPVEQPAPFAATWELRFGPGNRLRVFYEINRVAHVVWILAIGIKERERLFIGGEEFKL